MEDELRCPKCNGSQTRFRVKTQDRICYQCGEIYKIKEVDKDGS